MTTIEKCKEGCFVRKLRIKFVEVIVGQVTGSIVPVEIERDKHFVSMINDFVAVVIWDLGAVTRVKEHALISGLRVFQQPGKAFADGRASCPFIEKNANVFGVEANLLQRRAHFEYVIDATLEAVVGIRVIVYPNKKSSPRCVSRHRSGGVFFSNIFQ